jgi:RHS repeat-associated protein
MDYNTDGDVSSIWGTANGQNRLYANGMSYNSSGAIERLRLGNGKWETTAYNNRLQVTQIGLGSSATDKSLLKLEYGYGTATQNNGSLRSQQISFNGLAQPFEQTYGYDDLNRLLSAEEKVNSVITWKQIFLYDRYGNRRFDAANTTTIAASNKVTNPQINTSDNRLKKDQDGDSITDYDFDKDGNVTLDAESKKFVYDAASRQIAFFGRTNNSNTPDATYFYDGEGKRVKKISSTEMTLFVYDGGEQLVAEYSTTTNNQPQISYLTNDHLGSPRVVTDGLGKVIARHDYSAFGDETFTIQRTQSLNYKPDTIRQDYTGYQKDDESGLEYSHARYYNSSHGRFTSVDPLTASASIKNPQTFNRYSYVLNSPYKFSDPLGLKPSTARGERGFNKDLADFLAANMTDASGYRGTYEAASSPVVTHTSGQSHTSTNSSSSSLSAAPPLPPIAPKAEQNTQEQTKKTLYIFYGFVKGDGDIAEGITTSLSKTAPDFSSLGGNVKIIDVVGLGSYEGEFIKALQDPNSLGVLYIGHGGGEVGSIRAIKLNGYGIGPDGDFTNEEASKVSGIQTPIVGIFSCGGSVVASNLKNAANSVIAMDSGKNDVTSIIGIIRSGYSAARAILSGANPDNVVGQANKAFKPVISLNFREVGNTSNILDQGDKVVRLK